MGAVILVRVCKNYCLCCKIQNLTVSSFPVHSQSIWYYKPDAFINKNKENKELIILFINIACQDIMCVFNETHNVIAIPNENINFEQRRSDT